MRTEINEKGKLSITPETPMEGFALTRWFADYTMERPLFAVLEVVAYEVPTITGQYNLRERA